MKRNINQENLDRWYYEAKSRLDATSTAYELQLSRLNEEYFEAKANIESSHSQRETE